MIPPPPQPTKPAPQPKSNSSTIAPIASNLPTDSAAERTKTLHTTTGKHSDPAWVDSLKIKELPAQILAALLAGFIGYLLLQLWNKLKEPWGKLRNKQASSAKHIYFDEKALANAQLYFQEHQLQLLTERPDSPWADLPASCKSLEYFWQEFTNKDSRDAKRVYLVMGPTGIGKTTFLLNLYADYAKKTAKQAAPDLVLGPLGFGYPHFYATQLAPRMEKGGGSANTILLLDALDEYRYQHTGQVSDHDSDVFEKEFSHFWDHFQEKVAPYFLKVVITVREQFFQTWQQQNLRASQHETVKLRLVPFNQATRKAYIDARYSEQKPETKATKDGLKALNDRLTELARANNQLTTYGEGRTFLEIPLLLTLLEDVWKEQQKLGKMNKDQESNFLAGHNVGKVLVEAWLKREEKEKGLHPDQLREFCQRLAAALVATGPYASLSATDLKKLESQTLEGSGESIIAAFEGRGDRSLLVRKGSPRDAEFRFEFVHEQFLGYFLMEYIEPKGTAPKDIEQSLERERNTPFERNAYALRYIMGTHWRAKREWEGLPKYSRVTDPMGNVVSREVIRAWGRWLDGLTCNENARLAFRESWMDILNKEAPDWELAPEVEALQNMRITPANIWQADDVEAMAGARHLRDFITAISIQDCSTTAKQLFPLDGARKLTRLIVSRTGLPADFLSYFTTSLPHLTHLFLAGIALSEVSAELREILRQHKHLERLDLNNSGLPADALPLARLPHLSELTLEGMSLTKAPAKLREALRRNTRLEKLNLRNTGLTAEALPLGCLPQLSEFILDGMDLAGAPAELHEVLRQNTCLEKLVLDNTGLAPEALPLARLPHLTNLYLDGMDLAEASAELCEALRQNTCLEKLSLRNTGLTAKALPLARLPYLTYLYLDGMDLAGAPAELHEALRQNTCLEKLDLSNTRLAAEALPLARLPYLTQLGLAGMMLVDTSTESREAMRRNTRLEELKLDNTGLNSELLALFANAGPTLTWISVEGNPAITEASFDCFTNPADRARLLQSAIANGWERPV